MEFSVDQKTLAEGLAAVQGCLEKRSTIPIISMLKFESVGETALRITATDLDVTIQREVAADIALGGETCIDGRRLIDLIRNLAAGTVHFKTDGEGWIRLNANRSKFRLATRVASEYPEAAFVLNNGVSIEAAAMRTMISRVVIAATNIAARYSLDGAKLEVRDGLARLIATDSNRLALAEIACDGTLDVFIPRKALNEIAKLDAEALVISSDQHHIFVVAGEQRLMCRKTTFSFPRYEPILPKDNDAVCSFDVGEMKSAIRRLAMTADDELRSVKMSLTANEIVMRSQARDAGEGEETIGAEYDGTPMEIGFQWPYILDFLAAIDSDRAALLLKDAHTQAEMNMIGTPGYRYIVVPVNLNVKAQREAAEAARAAV